MPKNPDTQPETLQPTPAASLQDGLRKIIEARHHDPFSILGKHGNTIRVFIPGVQEIRLAESPDGNAGKKFQRIENTDCFELTSPELPEQYKLEIHDSAGNQRIVEDPYRFNEQLGEIDLHLFSEGRHHQLYNKLGSHHRVVNNVSGVLFAVWAPGAERVSVVGDFNQWDGRVHSMRSRGESGIWELFLPRIESGTHYKFEVRNAHGNIQLKQDPFANHFELRPDTASLVTQSTFQWTDQDWINNRTNSSWQSAPCSIYEVHLGSWQRTDDNQFLNYKTLAHKLVEYVQYMGFTHIELLPITEHPLDDSWG